ncbi:O-antigen ligase [Altererythrobacter atlanticus]|nr:O-antigen ligase family protein [Croceibacterium atlanticum]MBB5734131.1 O-antigen ligase [Croceibacterium atlanticum]
MLIFGGAPNRIGLRFDSIVLAGAILLAAAVWHGALAAFQKLPFWFRLFAVLVMVLPLVQLIPLPPSVWRSFPGRETATAILDLVGAGQRYRPLSLDPMATLAAWLSLVPAFALFLASITLGDRERRYLGVIVVSVALLAIVIGVFQFGSRGALFNFYDSSHRQYLLGFFANRNHQALFLCMSAIWFSYLLETDRRLASRAPLIVTLLLILVGGAILATFSRTGVALFMVVTAVLVYRILARQRKRKVLGLGLLVGATLIALTFMSSNNIVANFFERYDTVETDARWNFWVVSWQIIKDNFPIGSGLGTFVPIYAAYEPLVFVDPRYVNHVHNDYLELLLEAGVAAGVLLLFALVLFVLAVSRLRPWSGERPAGLLLLVPLLVATHSIVDYPMRTVAIFCVLALVLAEVMAHWCTVKDTQSGLG